MDKVALLERAVPEAGGADRDVRPRAGRRSRRSDVLADWIGRETASAAAVSVPPPAVWLPASRTAAPPRPSMLPAAALRGTSVPTVAARVAQFAGVGPSGPARACRRRTAFTVTA